MKKNLLIFAALLLSSFAGISQSQLNLIIFSEDGDQFFAYINGIKQNAAPESNVKVTNLTSPNISLRIEFTDKALPQLKQNMMLEMGFEHTAKIMRDMKKQVKLRYFGQVPINQSPKAEMSTVAYHTAENTEPVNNQQSSDNTVTTSSTTTSTSYNTDNGNGGMSINVGAGSAGISMNVSGTDPMMNTTTTTTVTKNSTVSTNNNGQKTDNYQKNKNIKTKPVNVSKENKESKENTLPVTSVKAGCSTAMPGSNFSKMKQAIESKPFSDTKMSTAKVATKNACLSVNQIKEIAKLFTMDDDRLAYAKYAYDYCVDKAEYYQVSDIFSFNYATEDLNKFLEAK